MRKPSSHEHGEPEYRLGRWEIRTEPQKLLGHKTVGTTMKYLHVIDEKWSNTPCLLELVRRVIYRPDQVKTAEVQL
jgi:integrase